MKLLAGVAMVGLALAGAEAWASVLFEEDFTNYGDTAPGMVAKAGLRVGNDPIWSCTAQLNVQPKEDFELYVKPVPLTKDGRFDLRFDFNLHNGATNNPSGFDLVLGMESGRSGCR